MVLSPDFFPANWRILTSCASASPSFFIPAKDNIFVGKSKPVALFPTPAGTFNFTASEEIDENN